MRVWTELLTCVAAWEDVFTLRRVDKDTWW